ncbi:hypothetical protein [Neptunicella sp. SCSIO 80796]|uniref:hypothetical protein n=1 Tax=Neptunicella plasticusilytica TaxID=3117012 RepID=UPI003A4D439D
MIRSHSLHSFRTASTLSKYGLVLLLLFSFVVAKLYVDHDASHLVKPDNHCALCLSAANADHALPPTAVILNNAVLPSTVIQMLPMDEYESTVTVTRNRGPPEKLNS